jgi:hypothetical protein
LSPGFSILDSNKISVKELLSVIPDELLANMAQSSTVDYQVKKLYGKSMFYLLLYGLLESNRASLRSLEEVFNSTKFKVIFNLDKTAKTKFNSISDRLSSMDESYFRQAYELLYKEYSNLYSIEDSIGYNITRVDSTMVVEVANKIQEGMHVGKSGKESPKQIKYTISLTNLLPSSVEVFTSQLQLSEDYSIPQAIMNHIDHRPDNVFVFDRGVSSRKAFNQMDNSHLNFVTRVNPKARHKVIEQSTLKHEVRVNNLIVIQDEKVIFYDKKHKPSNVFRLIQTIDHNNDPLWFVTNLFEDTVEDIINIYKKRWDIEVFFRFIKQELNFKHFISTSINGISILLYMTLILSMLILIYKRVNNLGYKTAKRRFYYEIDELYMSMIIRISGGDPSLVFR